MNSKHEHISFIQIYAVSFQQYYRMYKTAYREQTTTHLVCVCVCVYIIGLLMISYSQSCFIPFLHPRKIMKNQKRKENRLNFVLIEDSAYKNL